jgi:hypothetical protein
MPDTTHNRASLSAPPPATKAAPSPARNKPLLYAVAGVAIVAAIGMAAMNMFGGPEPGTPLSSESMTQTASTGGGGPANSKAAPGAPAAAAPAANPNEIPQLAPDQVRKGAARLAPGTK